MFDQRESYTLEPGSSSRLEISWGFFSREIVLFLDGEELGKVARTKITKPHQFILPDGSRLTIQQRPGFKLLGMGFQPYLHITRDGETLPGVIPSYQEQLQNVDSSLLWLVAIKVLQALFAPNKPLLFPQALDFPAWVEWHQGFTGSLLMGCLFLVLLYQRDRRPKLALTVALGLILGNLFLQISCLWVCVSYRPTYLAAIEGLAAAAIYQALRSLNHSRQPL